MFAEATEQTHGKDLNLLNLHGQNVFNDTNASNQFNLTKEELELEKQEKMLLKNELSYAKGHIEELQK
jgi:hypothetical protein